MIEAPPPGKFPPASLAATSLTATGLSADALPAESAPSPPDAASLREAALAHLARFATTRRNLEQVLVRRVRRWGVRALKAGMEESEIAACEVALRPLIAEIVAGMEELGAVDDAQFARSRARNLTRTGRSRRAVAAHLMVKGVDSATTETALEESLGSGEQAREAELAAALVLARKRRIGPFQRPPVAPEPERDDRNEYRYEYEDEPHDDRDSSKTLAKSMVKIMAVFARNGFNHETARRALDMTREEAEEVIVRFRAQPGAY